MADEPTTVDHCPTCESPDPRLHPAVQFEGEVSICRDPWHVPARCPTCGSHHPDVVPPDREDCIDNWHVVPDDEETAARHAAMAALREERDRLAAELAERTRERDARDDLSNDLHSAGRCGQPGPRCPGCVIEDLERDLDAARVERDSAVAGTERYARWLAVANTELNQARAEAEASLADQRSTFATARKALAAALLADRTRELDAARAQLAARPQEDQPHMLRDIISRVMAERDEARAKVERLRWSKIYRPSGRCRLCSGTENANYMHCEHYVGPLEHRWVWFKPGVFGRDHGCSCGAWSDDAELACPRASETWRGAPPDAPAGPSGSSEPAQQDTDGPQGDGEAEARTGLTAGAGGGLAAAIEAARSASCEHQYEMGLLTPCLECRIRAAAPHIERDALERAAADLRSADTSGWPGGRGYEVEGCRDAAVAWLLARAVDGAVDRG